MNNTQSGVIFSVYQLGYITSGVLLSTLSDKINIRWIFITAAIWSGIANLLFALLAHDYLSGMILRGLTGIGMGGTYMPGLKLVAERFSSHQRGRAVGIYVGALVLGASLSLAVPGIIAGVWGWRIAMIICSIGVFIGAGISIRAFQGYKPASSITPENNRGFSVEILQNRPALLVILGYASHMWEMYGMRSWLAPFFAAALTSWGVSSGNATATASAIAALLIGIGTFSTAVTGSLSDRLGRTTTVSVVMIGSVICSCIFGWLINTNLWLTLTIGVIYGWLIVAESPVFSTALTELVAPNYLGAAMGMQSLVGYTMGMISPTVFGWTLDCFQNWQPWPGVNGAWGLAFITVGLGGLVGPVCMWRLRNDPASLKLAQGKR